jgi:hypothetical protein
MLLVLTVGIYSFHTLSIGKFVIVYVCNKIARNTALEMGDYADA